MTGMLPRIEVKTVEHLDDGIAASGVFDDLHIDRLNSLSI